MLLDNNKFTHKKYRPSRPPLISLREWARSKGLQVGTVRNRSLRGHELPPPADYSYKGKVCTAYYTKESLNNWLKEWSSRK